MINEVYCNVIGGERKSLLRGRFRGGMPWYKHQDYLEIRRKTHVHQADICGDYGNMALAIRSEKANQRRSMVFIQNNMNKFILL